MFTTKQFLISFGLTIIGNALIVTAALADDISFTNLQGSNFIGAASAGDYSVGGIIAGKGLAGGVSIPPEMSVPSSAASGISSDSSGSGVSGGGSSGTRIFTVADIANYFTSSIDRSLDDINTPNIAQQPRRIVRRRSAVCPNPQISRSWETLDDLLNQSEQFIEQVNQIKPENSIW